MSTAEHTPWSRAGDGRIIDGNGSSVIVSGFAQTVMGGSYIPARVTTDFIINAVNSHADLLASLQEMLEEYETHDESAYCQVGTHAGVTAKARAAIAKATGSAA